MTRRLTAWMISGLVALSVPAGAQTAAPASDKDKQDAHETCRKEGVKTWTVTEEGKEWAMRTGGPGDEGCKGLFHLSSAYTLMKGKFSFSLFRDNRDRDPKGLDLSTHGLTLAYGATDKLEVFGDVGVQERVKAHYLFQPGFYNDNPFVTEGWETGFGDIRIGAKYAFLNDYRGDKVGLALKGAIKFGTADENKGLGTGKTSGAVDLVLSKHLNKNADLHGSVGYEINGDPTGVDLANAFK